ncbi:hypothetical protein CMV30_06720 [Nibricoccus aquaticus]|uniref:Uncharacterized protein n=1 Tax=Nibricoccus aquaticus TaxID=2576891 RepID=A0A290Q4R3_9BACT|nr:hypothetical protein [Nibricoccus aquaticus]ATC63669.1 hypothetical protein CMV30_06720 [Nibricoccus aquaticus]
MPSTISFLPAPAPASSAPANPSSAQSSNDSGASFDSALNQASPSSGKSGPRNSVTGSVRAAVAAEKAAQAALAEAAAKAAKEAKPGDQTSTATDKDVLNPEELAALLTFIGAPVALQQPPSPEVPADFSIAGDTRSPDSADVHVECDAKFAAPQFTTGKDREVYFPDTVPAEAVGAQETDTTAAFTLDPAATDAGLTTRDLLQQGAEVIDYQLQPELSPSSPSAESGLAIPADMLSAEQTPFAPTPASSVAPAVTDASLESATFAQQSSGSAAPAHDAANLRRLATQKTSSRTASEKIAASLDSGVSPIASGVNPSIGANKNNFLSVGDKELARDMNPVGTDAANWGDSMNQDARSTPFVARLIDGALSLLGTSAAGTKTMERPSEAAATSAVSSTQAAQIVSEIRDIADGLWAVERNSVEVRFNFSQTERLSVKVEYRDGVVKTTFRTDSPELRDTIAREWQVQVASASDSRPYRVADPVFNTPPADARGFSLGGDSSRQQRQAEQSANAAAHTFATTTGRGPSSSTVAAAPATAFARPDTALHLHAFA